MYILKRVNSYSGKRIYLPTQRAFLQKVALKLEILRRGIKGNPTFQRESEVKWSQSKFPFAGKRQNQTMENG